MHTKTQHLTTLGKGLATCFQSHLYLVHFRVYNDSLKTMKTCFSDVNIVNGQIYKDPKQVSFILICTCLLCDMNGVKVLFYSFILSQAVI